MQITDWQVEEGKKDYKGSKVSEGCKTELDAFKISRSTNINKDVPLAEACLKVLPTVFDLAWRGLCSCGACGHHLARCVCRHRCQVHDCASDWHVQDVEKLCSKLPKDTHALACLREHKDELNEGCKKEVFERQAVAADDWRTDPELLAACKVRWQLSGAWLPTHVPCSLPLS